MSTVPFPATPPTRPSLPNLPSSSSLSSLPSPASPPISQKNYHPYLIQSTSSSLLTRSNSSPSQPLSSLGKHRPSRSMSSLANVANSPCPAEDEVANRRRSMESPGRPVMKRSGTLPSFLEEKEPDRVKEVVLPLNPKSWTPSELAQYLGYTLRKGGADGNGQILPAPLVEDIKSWVLRQRVTGRAFLRGNTESWGSSSRPPPFLPTLLSISRRLRRSSIQGGIFDDEDQQPSTLLEENENDGEDEEISGVKRMAHRLEARDRDSASDISMSEDEFRLRPQLTGGSEGWERWGVKRHNTGEGVRRNSGLGDKPEIGMTQEREREASPEDEEIVTPLLNPPDELDDDMGGTIRAAPPGLERSEDDTALPSPDSKSTIRPEKLTLRSRDGMEITPTLEKSSTTTRGLGLSPKDGTPTKYLSHAIQPIQSPDPEQAAEASVESLDSKRYASLRQGSTRLPSRRRPVETGDGGYDSSDDLPGSSTTRKVTIKASNPLGKLFDPPKSAREEQLETQLKEVMQRVTVLEKQLEVASEPQSPIITSRPGTPISPGSVSGQILGGLGLVKTGDDGLPRSVGELPAYLFFVGFGVGAVMMRVIFGRAR